MFDDIFGELFGYRNNRTRLYRFIDQHPVEWASETVSKRYNSADINRINIDDFAKIVIGDDDTKIVFSKQWLKAVCDIINQINIQSTIYYDTGAIEVMLMNDVENYQIKRIWLKKLYTFMEKGCTLFPEYFERN